MPVNNTYRLFNTIKSSPESIHQFLITIIIPLKLSFYSRDNETTITWRKND